MMVYTVIDKQKAQETGFPELTHRCVGDKMILNEKEIMFADIEGDTVEGKIETLGGEVMTESEVQQTIEKGGI